jgi:CBS domain-containing protein
VFSCYADDNVNTALATMAKRHIRRLPVLDKQGRLQGVLSIDDVVQAPSRRSAPTAEEIIESLKGIMAPTGDEIHSA